MILPARVAFEVEMVGGLVEQQQFGRENSTAAGRRRIRQPPEKSVQGLAWASVLKAQPGEDFGRPGFGGMGLDVG